MQNDTLILLHQSVNGNALSAEVLSLHLFVRRTAVLKIDSGRVCFYDVDETLVHWDSHGEPEVIFIDGYPLLPNTAIISSLERNRIRGFTIIVWSQSGCDWAEKVVKALKLEHLVDFVMSKPERYYDDYSCDKWMGQWKDSNNYRPDWKR